MIVLQWIYLLHDCEVKPDIHVEIENSGIWLVLAEKDLDHSVYI